MSLRCRRSLGRRRATGTAMIVALFIVIVIAVLGVLATRITAVERQTVNLELQAARARAAAFSGLEWGSNRAATLNTCSGSTVLPPIGSFTVTVTCTDANAGGYNIGGTFYRIYDLHATAVSGTYGRPDFVQRSLDRRVSNIPPGTW